MTSTAPLRIATVEDDPCYRRSFTLLVRSLPSFSHVASYDSAAPVLAAARKARQLGQSMPWDLVLTDIGLPDVDGIQLTRDLKATFPALRVIALTVFDDPASVLAAICAGADGYLLKGVSSDEMIAQLELIRTHQASITTSLAGTVLRLVRQSHHATTVSLPRDLGLSPRQIEVLRALVDGLSYRQAGERLGISIDTVRGHVRQVYATLQVHSVAEAVGFALRNGLA